MLQWSQLGEKWVEGMVPLHAGMAQGMSWGVIRVGRPMTHWRSQWWSVASVPDKVRRNPPVHLVVLSRGTMDVDVERRLGYGCSWAGAHVCSRSLPMMDIWQVAGKDR